MSSDNLIKRCRAFASKWALLLGMMVGVVVALGVPLLAVRLLAPGLLTTIMGGTHDPRSYPPFPAGDKLIACLNAHFEHHERYPDSLDDLVPEFVSDVPSPDWGTDEWYYWAEQDGQGFTLGVIKPDFLWEVYDIFYSSRAGRWRMIS